MRRSSGKNRGAELEKDTDRVLRVGKEVEIIAKSRVIMGDKVVWRGKINESEGREERMESGDDSQVASSPQNEEQMNQQMDMKKEADMKNMQRELDKLKEIMSEECFKSAQRLVESCSNQTPPNSQDLHQIFTFILQKSDKGPKNSERSDGPGYKAETSSSSSSLSCWAKATVKVFQVNTGKTCGADQNILEQVKNVGLTSTWKVETTRNLQESDVIIVFCPIMSRVGSDLEAAMREDSGKRLMVR
ncbi:uncharacterized protein LOC117953065 [Etheostoma cragini]|uniref:uncharacterized protein LOC117953065 n=1 Tax=Etheostoma cragini TaxID=417921 RepID=UPI00155F30DC|nr:uncharacterized protein LOC117953065 [Etheostoma cragini]